MGMEIPGVVPSGLHSDIRTADFVSKRRSSHREKNIDSPNLEFDIKEAVAKLEKMVTQFNRRFEISLNEQINRIVVKVIDTDTDKVIREIPPEEIQHLLSQIDEMMGLFINERI